MANFKVTVEENPRNPNVLFVRHRDGKTKLANGRWKRFHDYTVDKNDRQVIAGKTYTGKSLANALAEVVRQRYYSNELGIVSSTETMEELIESYLDSKSKLAWRTLEHYSNSLRHLKEAIPTLPELTTDNLRTWEKNLTAKFKRNSVYACMNDTSIFCNWLVREDKISKTPFKKGMVGTVEESTPKFYQTTAYLALDESLAKVCHYTRVGCWLAHDHGLRKVEIVGDGRERMEGVLWEDLIWRSNGKVDLQIRKEVSKGKKKARKVRLDPKLVELLGSRKTGPIVPLVRWVFDDRFQKARKMAGIDKDLHTIHGLRHSFGNEFMQKSGSNQVALRDLMGHTDVKTTEIYSHLEESYLDEAMDNLHEKRSIDNAKLKVAGQNNDISLEIIQQPLTNNNEDQQLNANENER